MLREFYQEDINCDLINLSTRLHNINNKLNDYYECNNINEFRFKLFKDLTPKYDLMNLKFDHLKYYYECHEWIKIDNTYKLINIEFQKKDIPHELQAFVHSEKSTLYCAENNLCELINFNITYDIYIIRMYEYINKLHKYIDVHNHYNSKIYLDENDISFLNDLIYNVQKAESYLNIDVF